ncbi:MAG: nucleotidyltransferase family protein [Ardenticatenaceae bacterium]|nr:nucleotidyltransferase family protein [Ardenticatenaceae bacterium]
MRLRTETALWPEAATARFILEQLTAAPGSVLSGRPQPAVPAAEVAAWLVGQGLGPLAYARCGRNWPELGAALQADRVSAAAESSLQLANMEQLQAAFGAAGLPLVLLKGAALGLGVYDEPAQRTMTDVDLWLQAGQMPLAAQVMAELGYQSSVKGERPLALERLSRGEIRFVRPGWETGLVEIHWSPFLGWWLTRTAAVEDQAIWARLEPLGGETAVYQLAPEDMVIHLAVHTAVNHQFGMSALRSLVDIALTAEKRGVDWGEVAERARAWRVGTAVYTVLDLLDALIGVAGMAEAVETIRPSALRRWLLRRFVTPESVLAGQDWRHGWQRYLLLLLLVDRARDMARLVGRTLWPEQEWLTARYGEPTGHGRHLWRLVKERGV